MVAQVGALRVTVGADITGLKTGMAQAQRSVASSSRAMSKQVSDLQLTFKEMATTAGRSLRVLAGTFAVGFGVRELLNVADAAKTLTAQLKLATAQYGSFEQANKDVRNIAQKTRSDLLSTAELYAALQRNADQLGASQQQVARTTETVSKAFKISGATTDEAANATRQLLQAFQSGRLQGDEFRSLMENAPRLTRLLADSLGTTIGNLRKLSKEGELTSDQLLRAFTDKKFTDELDKEFARLPVTFEQAIGQVYNSAVIVFGAFDRGGQFSTALANFFMDGTEGFDNLENRAYRFGAEVRGIGDALDSVKDAFGSLHTTGILGLTGLENATVSLTGAIGFLLDLLDSTIQKFADLARAPYNLIQALGGGPLATGKVTDFGGNFRAKVNARVNDASRRQIMGRSAQDVLAEFGMGRSVPAFRPSSSGGGGGGKKSRAARAPKDRSAEVEYQFDQDILRAKQDVLEAQKSLAKSADEQDRISLQILDLQKEDQQAELANKVRRAEKDYADKSITKAALDKVKADAEILQAKYDEKDRLERQAILDAKAERQRQDAARIEDTKFDIKREQLQSDEAIATTAKEQRDIQLRLLDLAYQQERAALERVLADKQATDAAKQEAQLRLNALNSRYQSDRAGVIANTRGPLESYFSQVPKDADEAREAMERLQVMGIDGAINSIIALTEGFNSFRDTAINAIKAVIAELIRMQLMKLAFSLIGGGGGSTSVIPLSGGVMSITDFPGRAIGGPVAPGQTYLVGERGPELFRPNESGSIVPNHALGAATNFNVTVNGAMSDVSARRTGMQIAAGFQSQVARARSKGIS